MHLPDSTILAIDSSTGVASIALVHAGHVFERSLDAPNTQAAELVPCIEAILSEANIAYDQLEGLAATVGPGSFTGIRIGLAVARTLASQLSLPVLALTTSEVMAWGYAMDGSTGSVRTAMRAGKGQAYSQLFKVKDHHVSSESELELLYPDALETTTTIIGNGTEACGEPHVPHARFLLAACAQQPPSGDSTDLTPCYIRPPDAIKPKPLVPSL